MKFYIWYISVTGNWVFGQLGNGAPCGLSNGKRKTSYALPERRRLINGAGPPFLGVGSLHDLARCFFGDAHKASHGGIVVPRFHGAGDFPRRSALKNSVPLGERNVIQIRIGGLADRFLSNAGENALLSPSRNKLRVILAMGAFPINVILARE